MSAPVSDTDHAPAACPVRTPAARLALTPPARPVRTPGAPRRRLHLGMLGLVGPLMLGATIDLGASFARAEDPLARAMRRARELRDQSVREGDQAYGAVVLREGLIVGEGPSRVVALADPSAHAEREAMRDAMRRLGRESLAGCLLVSTSRPCGLCERFARGAGIARMIHGEALTDAGAPA